MLDCYDKAGEYHRKEPWGIGVCLVASCEIACACGNYRDREKVEEEK